MAIRICGMGTKGNTIDGYSVVRLVAEGSAAWIYQVRREYDGSSKVAKVLKPAGVQSPETLTRFQDEYRVLRTLHHPSLPEVYDYGFTNDGLRYMIMEYIEGVSLDVYHDTHPEDVWVILYELCEVITFIHSHDLLHQDIKPENILVTRTTAFGTEKPLVMLMDFGLTYRRNVGMKVSLVGTPEYMAPEIVRGEAPLTRSVDYYSLGATLFELVAGRPPFIGKTKDVLNAHLNRQLEFDKEHLEYAELYQHIRALLTKDAKSRLEAFGELRSSATNHVTGGIDELEQAYAKAHIDSVQIGTNTKAQNALRRWTERISQVTRAPGRAVGIEKVFVVGGERGAGKTRVVEDAVAEARIAGIRIVDISELRMAGNRTESDIWDTLSDSLHGRGVIVVVDKWDQLTPDAQDIASYLAKRSAIERTLDDRPLLWFIVIVEQMLAPAISNYFFIDSDELAHSTCSFMSEKEYRNAVDLFRSKMDGQTDKQHLAALLVEEARLPGVLLAVISRLLDEGYIRSRGGRWKAASGAEKISHARADKALTAISANLGRLATQDKKLVYLVACSGSRLYFHELALLGKCSEASVVETFTNLQRLRFVRVGSDMLGNYVELVSEQFRHDTYETIEYEDRSAIHRCFVESISREDSEKDFRLASILAFQYRALGDAKAYLRAALPWSARLRLRGEAFRSRMLCRQMLSAISAIPLMEGKRRTYRRLILTHWIREEYARGGAQEIIAIYENHFKASDRLPPLGLIKYFGDAFDWVNRGDEIDSLVQAAILNCAKGTMRYFELVITHASIQSSQGKSREALQDLYGVLKHNGKLTEFNRLRLFKAIALGEEMIADVTRGLASAERLESIARKLGMKNELSLAYLIRGNALFTSGKYEESLVWVRKTVRLATKAGLRHRLMIAYFLASAVYYERGEYSRALRYLKRANDIATSEGRTASVCSYGVRLAMISEKMGQYGDALQYIRQAKDVGIRFSLGLPATKASLFELDLLISIGHNDLAELIGIASERMRHESHSHHSAYFEFIQGAYWEGRDWERARHHFERSMTINREFQYYDDEIRAALRVGYASLAIGDRARALEVRSFISRMDHIIDSLSIQTELALFNLSITYCLRNSSREQVSLARRCAEHEQQTNDKPLRIEVNRMLFRYYCRLGKLEQAKDHFNRFYELLRYAMSSFRNRVYATRYFETCQGGLMLEEYRICMRANTEKESHRGSSP